MKKNLAFIVIIVSIIACKKEILPSFEGVSSETIRLNQIGYYPKSIKKAIVVDSTVSSEFKVVNKNTMETVFSGTLSETIPWELAGEKVKIADFSKVTQEGEYLIYITGVGYSHPFEIKNNVLREVLVASIKAMYYQRASIPLEEKYAGKWHRPIGHSDDSVMYHPSSGKKEGFRVSPKGWYDAGDYNKYVVNGSFPLGQFYLMQEHYGNIIKDNELNIPESGNGISDYLDELKYEMDWLLTMQDDDGGLFHKLTTKNFEGMVMPHEATAQRYIVGKGTAATLDFAACAAQAYRIFRDTHQEYASNCLKAARKAYEWALRNPDTAFTNPEDISTGEYGDQNFDDEWFWAAAELYTTTQDPTYLEKINEIPLNFEFRPGESWTVFMRFLGMFSLLEHAAGVPEELLNTIKKGILQSADVLVARTKALAYFQPIDDFQWGSNSDVLNAAMIMAQAYRLEKNPDYFIGVQQAMDYILGNNAVGYSYITGFGAKTPMFIHHRQSAADRIEEPVPGLLSGGPNSRLQDVSNGVVYPENAPPMKSWADQEPSYASNEICLNWNAPLTYILGFLEQESGQSTVKSAEKTIIEKSSTPVEMYGQLKVDGSRIKSECDTQVQMAGMSLFWHQWGGERSFGMQMR